MNPDGYYNVERLIKALVVMGNITLQGDWTVEADQVLVF